METWKAYERYMRGMHKCEYIIKDIRRKESLLTLQIIWKAHACLGSLSAWQEGSVLRKEALLFRVTAPVWRDTSLNTTTHWSGYSRWNEWCACAATSGAAAKDYFATAWACWDIT